MNKSSFITYNTDGYNPNYSRNYGEIEEIRRKRDIFPFMKKISGQNLTQPNLPADRQLILFPKKSLSLQL